jgi:hypothetical protein
LEIGAFEGEHTQLLLDHCESVDGTMIVIEPTVRPPLRRIVEKSKRVSLLAETSHAALPHLDAPVDAVLLEGDLNYHTVYVDLKGIGRLSDRMSTHFPLVIFASASWPYARRDMYYSPESLPFGTSHDYARKGLTPWSAGLEDGMINYPFANATMEGGPKNGVLTAVEDFVRETRPPLSLFSLPMNHGLGIIFSEKSPVAQFIQENLTVSPRMRLFLETLELARLNTIVMGLRARRGGQFRSGARAWIARRVRRFGRRLMAKLES